MVVGEWNLARLMAKRMVNIVVLVLWRYLGIFATQDTVFFGKISIDLELSLVALIFCGQS